MNKRNVSLSLDQLHALLVLLDFTPIARLHEELEHTVTQEFADSTTRDLITAKTVLSNVHSQG